MNSHPTILIVDNYDSFTYNLSDYFQQLGTEVRVLRNDELPFEAFIRLQFDALVLSPGPQAPRQAGHMMRLIDHYHQQLPMLGICLGHQGIGEFFGYQLTKAALPVHGKTSVLQHNGHPLFKGLPEAFEVMRYHSLILESSADSPLQVIAQTAGGEIMAVAHEHLPIVGLQFHPESILTEHGLAMLRNWLGTCWRENA